MSELTASDVLALTKTEDGNWCNNPFIYLVWLALLGGNGGFFGNRNNEIQGALTRSDLFEGFNNQDLNSQIRGLTNGLSDGFYAVNSSLKDNNYNAATGFANLTSTLQSCCCTTNRNIDDVKAEAYQNTCAITNAIHSEAEATRALIEQNTIQALRDKIEDKDRELQSANFLISQVNQNATLINALRPTPVPAYTVSSPYVSNSIGCGCTSY